MVSAVARTGVRGIDMAANVMPLERHELRKIWDHEANHFTPWLYLPETLDQLGKAVGLGRIEGVGREQQVGDFRADIVAKDLSGGQVLIENQLEQTDHQHLGQLLTYAAGISANGSTIVSVIWVASRIRAEHADALRWLNARTPENVGFYAVEITAWTIAGSPPGYRFDVIVRPDTTIQLGGAGEAALTPDQLSLRTYWSAFRDYLEERGAQHWMRPKLPKSEYWGGNFGQPGINIYAVAKPKSKSIAVMLELSDPANYQDIYEALLRERSSIEMELGASPQWSETAARRYVGTEHAPVELFDEKCQRDQFDWILNQLDRYRSVFHDRIMKLTEQGASSLSGVPS